MRSKMARILAATVAAVSLLSVSAYAKDYNTSAESGTANRILDGTEGEGSATILRGGVDRITATNQYVCPNTVHVTYSYDGTSETDKQVVRTSKGLINPTYTYTPYSVKKKGTYYEYWKVSATSADTSRVNRYITLVPNNATLKSAPTVKTLTYTGTAQQLVNAGSATNGTVKYKVNSGSLSTTIPSATNVGEYTITYQVEGSSNYNSLAPVTISTKAKINKANSTFTTAPAAKAITWTGEVQELISAGATTCGTVEYKLGDGEWSTNVPKATAVGEYTVYYRIVGDANHNDLAENSITATIQAKAATATYENIGDFARTDNASAWAVTVTPGSAAIESIDVKVNGKSSEEGIWSDSTVFSGAIQFGVAVNKSADQVESVTAVVDGEDVVTTLVD